MLGARKVITFPAQTIASKPSMIPRAGRSSSARSPTSQVGPGWSSSAAATSTGSTSTPTTSWPAAARAEPTRPGPQPASRTRAPRGTIASTRRASPARSAPEAAMVRNRSTYHLEWSGFDSVMRCQPLGSGTVCLLSLVPDASW
nr:hypothetical protein DA06_07725 [Georgenia sp. SUBG003]